MTPLNVLVHGATGVQGAPIARRLVAAGHHVRSVSRRGNASGIDGVATLAGDLGDVDSLAAAYGDVDAVVVQLPLVFTDVAVTQADNVLAAIERAGVRRAVFNASGPISPVPIGVPYVDARTRIVHGLAEVTEAATVVGPVGPYMENLASPASARRILDGELAYPVPAEVPMPWVALDDLAGVVADVLVAPRPPALRIVAGPAALTGEAAAAELAAATGVDVRWRTITPQEFERQLVGQIGPEAAAGIAAFYAAGPDGSPPPPDPSTVAVGPTHLREWAAGIDWRRIAAG